jgi:hypothetical protein
MDNVIAQQKFIIRIPMYRGKGRNKVFSCFYYVTGFSWKDMSAKQPKQMSYNADRSKACEMGKFTAEERLAAFRVIGEVVPA